MINSFLVSLHNDTVQPVNPSATVGAVVWPDVVRVKIYSGVAEQSRSRLYSGLAPGSFEHFLASIQFLWVVEESVLARNILLDDPRVTYSLEQLVGQFVDISSYDYQIVSYALQSLEELRAEAFLPAELLQVYRSALCRADKLAAIIAFFGSRRYVD